MFCGVTAAKPRRVGCGISRLTSQYSLLEESCLQVLQLASLRKAFGPYSGVSHTKSSWAEDAKRDTPELTDPQHEGPFFC